MLLLLIPLDSCVIMLAVTPLSMSILWLLLLLFLDSIGRTILAILVDAKPCERASAAAADLSKIYYRKPVLPLLLLLLLLICRSRSPSLMLWAV